MKHNCLPKPVDFPHHFLYMYTLRLLKDLICTGFLREPEMQKYHRPYLVNWPQFYRFSDPANALLILKKKSKWLKLIYSLVPFLPQVIHSTLITPFIPGTPSLCNSSACIRHLTFTFWDARTLSFLSLLGLFYRSLSTGWEEASVWSSSPGGSTHQCRVDVSWDAAQDNLPNKHSTWEKSRHGSPHRSELPGEALCCHPLRHQSIKKIITERILQFKRQAKLKHVVSLW